MQTLSVNGYDIAYLDVGRGADNSPPLVLVHGTLGDFRTWNAVLGPAVEEAPRDCAEPAALLSGALGRGRQRLPDGAARRRRDRLHRKARMPGRSI